MTKDYKAGIRGLVNVEEDVGILERCFFFVVMMVLIISETTRLKVCEILIQCTLRWPQQILAHVWFVIFVLMYSTGGRVPDFRAPKYSMCNILYLVLYCTLYVIQRMYAIPGTVLHVHTVCPVPHIVVVHIKSHDGQASRSGTQRTSPPASTFAYTVLSMGSDTNWQNTALLR